MDTPFNNYIGAYKGRLDSGKTILDLMGLNREQQAYDMVAPSKISAEIAKNQSFLNNLPQEEALGNLANQGKLLQAQDLLQHFPEDANLGRLVKRSEIVKNLKNAQRKGVYDKDRGGWVYEPTGDDPGVFVPATGLPAKPSKPLPAAIQKQLIDENDAANMSGDLNTRLKPFGDMIDNGKLELGAYTNLMNQVRNSGWVPGLSSTEQSRNFASFRANLEKLRNDSLRLNKGVQTEGDAQRAWNELIANINDPEVVKQRLSEIMQINDQARQHHMRNAADIKQNYGVSQQQPAADDLESILQQYAP